LNKIRLSQISRIPRIFKELDDSYGKISADKYAEQLKLFEEAGKYEAIKNQKINI